LAINKKKIEIRKTLIIVIIDSTLSIEKLNIVEILMTEKNLQTTQIDKSSVKPTTTTTTTTTTTNLSHDVKQIIQSYYENKDKTKQDQLRSFEDHEKLVGEQDAKLSENRKKGCDELLEILKKALPEKLRTYASYGRTEARIFDFKFRDELKFGGCYAKDLLTKGDVITRLQDYLDKEHSDDDGSAFFVYFTLIGRYQKDHNENKYGVFVNWDKKTWTSLKERIALKSVNLNSERKDIKREYVPHNSQRTEYRGGIRRGNRGGYRGGFNRGPSMINRIKPSISTTDQTMPLPEAHDE
jgi:hypothetical protein